MMTPRARIRNFYGVSISRPVHLWPLDMEECFEIEVHQGRVKGHGSNYLGGPPLIQSPDDISV